MLKKKNIFVAIVITIFFLIIASLTTFRLAIYAFVICYIGVIIAKSKNKRLKVPVVDFFILTFSFTIVLSFIYSYSPRFQYYEFVLSHSRWEVSQASKINIENISTLQIDSTFKIGTNVQSKIGFSNSNGNFTKDHEFDFYKDNICDLVHQNSISENFAKSEMSKISSNLDLFVFKKPHKEVYKFFRKDRIFYNLHSEANFVFSIFFFLIFIFVIIKTILNFKKSLSVLLNQYPKPHFAISLFSLIYVVLYLIFTLLIK